MNRRTVDKVWGHVDVKYMRGSTRTYGDGQYSDKERMVRVNDTPEEIDFCLNCKKKTCSGECVSFKRFRRANREKK